jgi:hypothetical protein
MTTSQRPERKPGRALPAEFSPCRTYRYVLRRNIEQPLHPLFVEDDGTLRADDVADAARESSRVVAFIMLNPSTADETLNDPTIRRCIGFARAWGFRHLLHRRALRWVEKLARAGRSAEQASGDGKP